MENLKNWYISNFKTDSLGKELSSKSTFEGLKNNLPNVYDYIGVGDSLVRERLFSELSKRLNISYDQVYNKWLYG
jgi:hypothetical protein